MSRGEKVRSKSIGHYILSKTIGEGTFGKVKLGTHILTGEKVAIKVLEKERIVDIADVERVARIPRPSHRQFFVAMVKKKKRQIAVEAENGEESAPASPKRSPAVAAAVAAAVAPVAAECLATGKKRRKQRPLASAESGDAPASAESGDAPASAEKKRKRKAKAAKVTEDDVAGDDAEEEEELPALLSNKKRKKSEAATAAAAAAAGTDAPAGKSSTKASSEERTVFVDGVPYVWTIEKIKEFFGGCGNISEVKAPTWQDSGRLRGFAHVTFESKSSRDKALAMDGVEAGKKGRYLKIEAAQAKVAPSVPALADLEGMRRLFVKNLPYEATEKEIQDLFKPCGPIVEVRIPTSFGRSKGFAYVEFKSSKGLQAACALDNPSVRGRSLSLDVDQGKGPKAGFHYRAEAFEPGVFGGRGGRGFGGKGDKGKGDKGKGDKGKGDKGKGRGKGKGNGDQKLSLF